MANQKGDILVRDADDYLVNVNVGDDGSVLMAESDESSGIKWADKKLFEFESFCINGTLDIWQRGTTQSSTGYGSADRWRMNSGGGSTMTTTRQEFTVGQTDVPGNPKYFCRNTVTYDASSTGYALMQQRMPNTMLYSSTSVLVRIWAKADSALYFSFEGTANYGNGGTPSTSDAIPQGSTNLLSTSWQQYEFVLDFPDVSAKTFGTNNNSYIAITFWFSAGSNYDSRSSSLGPQGGVFDIAEAEFIILDEPTFGQYVKSRRKGFEETLEECECYFQKSYELDVVPGTATEIGQHTFLNRSASAQTSFTNIDPLKKRMNGPPTVTLYPNNGNSPGNVYEDTAGVTAATVNYTSETSIASYISLDTASIASGNKVYYHYTADSEL